MAPVFDETFDLNISPLTDQTQLHFGVYDFDRYSRHDLIGAAVLQLYSHSQEGATERLHVLDIVAEKQVFHFLFDLAMYVAVRSLTL